MKQQMQASAYHLKPGDIKKLTVAAVNFRDRCLVKTLWWLALRRHEVRALDIRDIDFARKRVTVLKGKGEKTRVVPVIDDEFLSDLQMLIGARKTGAVFLSNEHKALSLRMVNHIVQKLGEKAGVKNPNPRLTHLNPHLIRHSMSRWLKSQGFPVEFVQNFLGHESYKTTMDMYGTMSIDEMQEVAARKLGE